MELPLSFAPLAAGLALLLAVAAFLAKRRTAPLAGKPLSGAVSVDASSAAGDDRPRVAIVFGTQTGTAERFAKQLKTEIQAAVGDATVVEAVDAEEYDAAARLPAERLALFLVATYGDGEPTDNAADLYAWLLRSAGEAEKGGAPATARPLSALTFGVFGLGNKQYEHFCAVGKRMHKALESLGATPAVRRGDGDDDDDIEGDFDAWRGELMAALKASNLLSHAAEGGAVAEAAPLPAFEVVPSTAAAAPAASGTGLSPHSPALATVTAVRELHSKPASERSCVHVEIDIAPVGHRAYEAGDHVGILPVNEGAVVEEAAALLGVKARLSDVVEFRAPRSASDLGHPVPGPITVRDALARHADLVGVASKGMVAAFARAATGDEATKLAALLAPDGLAAYKAWHAHSRCLLEIMREFPETAGSVGLGAFFGAVAPRPAVRFYSISSSPALQPTAVHVTAAVVRHEVATGRVHAGVATGGLARAVAGDRVALFLRKSTFRLPSDPSAPVIMIGPGTGLAPFRGFLQERAAAKAASPATLFFGCRSETTDYIYREELAAHLETGALTALHVAFSRAGASKDYVQHHLRAHAAALKAAVAAGGHVYVCGDAKAMARDVHAVLVDALGEAGVKALADGGRYLKDVW
jgi:NADPH-ferrihemoprotein reductase